MLERQVISNLKTQMYQMKTLEKVNVDHEDDLWFERNGFTARRIAFLQLLAIKKKNGLYLCISHWICTVTHILRKQEKKFSRFDQLFSIFSNNKFVCRKQFKIYKKTAAV